MSRIAVVMLVVAGFAPALSLAADPDSQAQDRVDAARDQGRSALVDVQAFLTESKQWEPAKGTAIPPEDLHTARGRIQAARAKLLVAEQRVNDLLGKTRYSVEVSKRTWKTVTKRELVSRYWRRGREFGRYRDVPDGAEMMIYLALTAEHLPRPPIMVKLAVGVRGVPGEGTYVHRPLRDRREKGLEDGDVLRATYRIRVDEASVDAFWMRWGSKDAVKKNTYVRVLEVVYADGTREEY